MVPRVLALVALIPAPEVLFWHDFPIGDDPRWYLHASSTRTTSPDKTHDDAPSEFDLKADYDDDELSNDCTDTINLKNEARAEHRPQDDPAERDNANIDPLDQKADRDDKLNNACTDKINLKKEPPAEPRPHAAPAASLHDLSPALATTNLATAVLPSPAPSPAPSPTPGPTPGPSPTTLRMNPDKATKDKVPMESALKDKTTPATLMTSNG